MRFASLFALLALVLVACPRRAEDPAGNGDNLPVVADRPRPLPAPLPGIDLGALADTEKRSFHDILETTTSPCGQAMSISQCVRDSVACTDCAHAARFLVRLLGEGYPEANAKEMVKARYDPRTKRTLSTEGCVWKGAASARLTIVEFADFECPHCRAAHETFEGLYQDIQFASSARLCYRFFPLEMHENARPAARAAVAAMNQGKFWPMASLLYANQTELAPTKFVEFATTLGLDLGRFRADFDLPATDARVQRDRAEGETLDLHGTPAIFVEGRAYEGSLDPDSIRAYVTEELAR